MVTLAAEPFVIEADGFAGGVSDVGMGRSVIPSNSMV
jgi:hypothetical protein